MTWRVNGAGVAGWIILLTLVAWFASPASPTWPETIVAGPLVAVAAWLIGARRDA